MADDAWNMERRAQDGPNSLEANSLPNGDLMPERQGLHELITQVISERRVDVNPQMDFDEQLHNTIREIVDSDAYKALVESGDVSRENISQLLDNQGMDRLPVVDPSQHATMLVTGGPATGKTALVERLADSAPEVFNDAVRLNPDDLKALLADPAIFGMDYDEMAHKEATGLADAIIERLHENLLDGGAPHAVLEGAAPNAEKMALAMDSNRLVVVGGTLPPEIALERSYERHLRTGQDVPTEGVLAGAQKVPSRTPMVFEHGNLEFQMYDTNVPFGEPQRLIATFDSETNRLTVTDPDAFIDFIERQGLNKGATSPEALFDDANRTPETISGHMQSYLEQGIEIDFIGSDGQVAMSFSTEGVEVRSQIDSVRGGQFYNDFAEASANRVVVPEAPRINGIADEALEAVQDLSRLARAARFAANTPAIGPAIGVGAAALTNKAHAGQRDYAEELLDQGTLSEEAYDAYIELNSQLEILLHGDNGLSTVDPTGLSIIITTGVELGARNAFQEWADQYAPHLTEDQFQSLAMSMFSGNSAQHEMFMDSAGGIPSNKEGQPEVLHDLIDARNAYFIARAERTNEFGVTAGRIPTTERQAELDGYQDAFEQARENFLTEMGSLLSNPETAGALLSAMPVDERLEFVRSLVESEPEVVQARLALNESQEAFDNNIGNGEFAYEELEAFQNDLTQAQEGLEQAYYEALQDTNPELAEYIREYNGSFTGWFLENDDVLYENPELLDQYIIARVTPDTDAPALDPAQETEMLMTTDQGLGDFSLEGATYAGDPDLANAAASAGVHVAEALIPTETIPDRSGLRTAPIITPQV